MKANDIIQLEKELSFNKFDNLDGYNIATSIIKRVKEEKIKNIRIRVYLNDEIVFQYLMNDKHGDGWLNRKQKTVMMFNHSSYYVYLKNEEDSSYQDYVNDDSLVICGGGFPIIVNDKIIGCITVSGLDHEDDHQLIVDALRNYKLNN